jgi:hypothetical protein
MHPFARKSPPLQTVWQMTLLLKLSRPMLPAQRTAMEFLAGMRLAVVAMVAVALLQLPQIHSHQREPW